MKRFTTTEANYYAVELGSKASLSQTYSDEKDRKLFNYGGVRLESDEAITKDPEELAILLQNTPTDPNFRVSDYLTNNGDILPGRFFRGPLAPEYANDVLKREYRTTATSGAYFASNGLTDAIAPTNLMLQSSSVFSGGQMQGRVTFRQSHNPNIRQTAFAPVIEDKLLNKNQTNSIQIPQYTDIGNQQIQELRPYLSHYSEIATNVYRGFNENIGDFRGQDISFKAGNNPYNYFQTRTNIADGDRGILVENTLSKRIPIRTEDKGGNRDPFQIDLLLQQLNIYVPRFKKDPQNLPRYHSSNHYIDIQQSEISYAEGYSNGIEGEQFRYSADISNISASYNFEKYNAGNRHWNDSFLGEEYKISLEVGQTDATITTPENIRRESENYADLRLAGISRDIHKRPDSAYYIGIGLHEAEFGGFTAAAGYKKALHHANLDKDPIQTVSLGVDLGVSETFGFTTAKAQLLLDFKKSGGTLGIFVGTENKGFQFAPEEIGELPTPTIGLTYKANLFNGNDIGTKL